jgi:carboxypeptidase family protein/TonB-dependent receptor-like protein
MKRYFFAAVTLLLAFVAFSNRQAYGQLADRAVITGVVTDASGAAVPDARVTVTNQATGVPTVVGTNSAGNYSTPPLILGTYSVEVEKQGFKTYTQSNISATGGQTIRADAKLDVGAATETVKVEANVNELVNSENATVQHTVGEAYYKDLPAVMGADIRLAESLLQLQPGYVPMQPNGDAIFRGSQFTSRMNGGQTMATENWFDGAAFGYAEGHQQTQESSIPYDSVREMTVVQNTFSAQYGHTSGGFITYTTKSGTSKLHGTLYDFYTNNKLDASNWFVGPLLKAGGLGTTLPLGQNNWGAALGGPIPKTKKTFWFFNYDGLDYHSTVNTGFVNTLPTPAERQGDFSQLLDTNTIVAHDAKGRPIYQGEIFNPATSTLFNGVPIRDGYGFDPVTGAPIPGAANIIPANDPLWSGVATTVIPNIPALDQNTLRNNGFGGSSDDNNKINVRTWLLRFDHSFNDKFSIANSYYENIRPRTAHCGGPQGCTTVHNGQTDPSANDTYIGQGFFQRITNHFEHLQMNWIIKPNVFNHTTIAYDRWLMRGHQLSAGVGWNQKLGLGLPDAPIFNNAGFPQLNFNGPNGYTHFGTPWASDGADINNRYQLLDDVTWVTGKHTIKAGMEYRYMTFPQTGWAVNTGGNFNFNDSGTAGYDNLGNILTGGPTGNEFASFILGQADSANFTIPIKYMPKMKYGAIWANDDVKVLSNLTLTFGLRFDWQGGLSEEFNRFSTFDPSAPNPVGIPGATVFNANKAYGKANWNVGPRFGFAYSFNPKTVIRGGYGMYYAGVQADSWDPYPVDGYQTNPVVTNLNAAQLYPAFYLGGPNGGTNGGCAAVYQSMGIACQFPQNQLAAQSPPQLRADVANGGNPVGVDPRTYTMPRYQNWSISFQRQLSNNMGIDIAYVGNHGTRLIDGRSSAGVYDNMNSPAIFGLVPNAADLITGAFTNGVPNAVATADGFTTAPYPTFTGTLAQSLRLWPQYQQINWRFFPFGSSHYNAIQVAFERRMSAGLELKVSYTHSKLMNNGAETGLGSGGPPVQNPVDMRDMYTVSSDDVPNILSFGYVYKLPFGKGRPYLNHGGIADKVLGGWQLSGINSYSSGRPLSITMPDTLNVYLFNYARFPNKGGSGLSGHFSNPRNDVYLNQGGWSDPGSTANGAPAFGNAPRMDSGVRGFPVYNEDLSIFKDTYFGEERYFRFSAQGGNIFNRQFWCPVDQFWIPNNGNGHFGKTDSQCNIPRRIQFGLQVFF